MYKEYLAHKKLKPTSPDIEGPFYKAGAPFRTDLCTYPTLQITGRVVDTDGNIICTEVTLDFWQADEKGVYVGYDKPGDFTFRGKQKANKGNYILQTVHPGDYQINDNPPDYRCSHIHVKIAADGFKLLTTQLYFADDPYDKTDHWFSKDRVIGKVSDSQCAFDFVLESV